jgi:AcrR family transcriptional regulator
MPTFVDPSTGRSPVGMPRSESRAPEDARDHLSERRRRADAERSITAIVEAAFDCLCEDPGVTMSAIARAAGVGRVTLYAHFPTRKALVDAVARRAVAQAADALDPEAGAGAPGRSGLVSPRPLPAPGRRDRSRPGPCPASRGPGPPARPRRAPHRPRPGRGRLSRRRAGRMARGDDLRPDAHRGPGGRCRPPVPGSGGRRPGDHTAVRGRAPGNVGRSPGGSYRRICEGLGTWPRSAGARDPVGPYCLQVPSYVACCVERSIRATGIRIESWTGPERCAPVFSATAARPWEGGAPPCPRTPSEFEPWQARRSWRYRARSASRRS